MTSSETACSESLSKEQHANVQHHGLTGHVEELEERLQHIRSSIIGEEEAVQKAAKSIVDTTCFNAIVISMTLVNTATMGLEADHPEWQTMWRICENIFTAGFLLEMLIKLFVYRLSYFSDKANWLDGFLALLGVLDCWILALVGGDADLKSLSVLRILRLLRLARIAKLVRSFKPFVLVIQGFICTISTTFYVFVLLIFITYVFAIFLTDLMGNGDLEQYPGYSTLPEVVDDQEVMLNFNPHLCFGSMSRSMLTLFNIAISQEWTEVVRPIAVKQPLYVSIFIVFAMTVSFGVMNVIIGMIVDNVISESKRIEDMHHSKEKDEKLQTLKGIQQVLTDMDTDEDGIITNAELTLAMESHPGFTQLLRKVQLPSGWDPSELLAMLDNNGDGHLQKGEFTTSFWRLMESTQFQQICMLQASLNQVKSMIHEGRKVTDSKFVALESELSLIKDSVCPQVDGQSQAQPIGEAKVVESCPTGETKPLDSCPHPAGEPWTQTYKQDSDHLGNSDPTHAQCADCGVDACTDGVCIKLRERVRHMSREQVSEIIDLACAVFQEGLANMKPSLEVQLKTVSLDPLSTSFGDSSNLMTPRVCAVANSDKINVDITETSIVPNQFGKPTDQGAWFPETPPQLANVHSSPDACQLSLDADLTNLEEADARLADDFESVFSASQVDHSNLDASDAHGQMVLTFDSPRLDIIEGDAHGAKCADAFQKCSEDQRSIIAFAQQCAAASLETSTGSQADVCSRPAESFNLGLESLPTAADHLYLRTEHAGCAEVMQDSTDQSNLVKRSRSPSDLGFEFTFREDTSRLGFEVHWVVGAPPVIGNVSPASAASVHGMLSGDRLAECNGISTVGKSRKEVLQLLGSRPLVLRIIRSNTLPSHDTAD